MSVTGSTIKTGVGPSVTVTLSIGGTADMAYVELGTSNSSRFTVTAVSKDVSNRTVTITVVGVAATPTSSPSGDATIKGLFHGVALCSGPNVVVLVPTTQSQVADTLSYWGNTSSGTSTIHLQTLVSRYSFITIKDQFNVTLSSLWNGSYKLDEEFSNLAGSLASELPTGRGPIYKPDHYLTNGVQLDECSHFVAIDVPSSALPGWNPTDWTNGGYFFSYFGASGYNLIQANYGSSTNHMIGDQKLWVWNTEITNQIRRDVGITGTSVPTISVSF